MDNDDDGDHAQVHIKNVCVAVVMALCLQRMRMGMLMKRMNEGSRYASKLAS